MPQLPAPVRLAAMFCGVSRLGNSLCIGLIGVTAVALAGCGSGEPPPPPLIPVSGTVSLDGKPLPGATLTFIPQGETQGAGGTGKTAAEGKYELTYGRGGKGVAAGEYRVTISKRVMPDGTEVPENDDTPPILSPARETLGPKYSDSASGILTASVREGGAPIDFALKK